MTHGKFEGKHSELTGKILTAFFQVHKELGYGFSEKVYGRAPAILLGEMGLKAETQIHLCVYFHRQKVGEYKDLFPGSTSRLFRNPKYSPSIP